MKNTKRNLHNLCLRILKDYGLDRDSYKTILEEEADDELKQAIESIEEELKNPTCKIPANPFTPKEIAEELIAIGNSCPDPKKDKYHLIWDTDNCTDGFDVGNNKKDLKYAMEDLLINWMMQFGDDKEHCSADDWDYMIFNCWCRCYRNADLVPDVDTDDIWCCYLTQDELKNIGWITTDEMDDDTYNSYAEVYGWVKRK